MSIQTTATAPSVLGALPAGTMPVFFALAALLALCWFVLAARIAGESPNRGLALLDEPVTEIEDDERRTAA